MFVCSRKHAGSSWPSRPAFCGVMAASKPSDTAASTPSEWRPYRPSTSASSKFRCCPSLPSDGRPPSSQCHAPTLGKHCSQRPNAFCKMCLRDASLTVVVCRVLWPGTKRQPDLSALPKMKAPKPCTKDIAGKTNKEIPEAIADEVLRTINAVQFNSFVLQRKFSMRDKIAPGCSWSLVDACFGPT